MMSIQGQTLEVRVTGCNKLVDTKWVSTQKPYVSIEYGGSKFLTSVCKDGGPNPTFQEKYSIILVEGLRELNVSVWSSNSTTHDHQIGSGSVKLHKVLSEGFDDTASTILSRSNRYAGEVCLIMHYSNANKPVACCASPAPQCCAPPAPQYYAAPQPQPQQVPLYYAPPQASYPPQPYPPHGYPPSPHHSHH